MNWLNPLTAKKTSQVLSEIDKVYNMDEVTKEIDYVMDNKLHRNDPRFFKKVKISIMALIKMLNHTLLGGNIEVMGLFQGYFTRHGEFYVMDSLALPVEATETRVNAGQEADNFMIGIFSMTQSKQNSTKSWEGTSTLVGITHIPPMDVGYQELMYQLRWIIKGSTILGWPSWSTPSEQWPDVSDK